MSLRSRLLLALGLAAVVPTALVVAVPILQAGRRADAETRRRLEEAARRSALLVEEERTGFAAAADRAAEELRGDHDGLAALVRGPESVASPVARGIAERGGFDRVRIVGPSGPALAAWGRGAAALGTLHETRTVDAGAERLTLDLERDLGGGFFSRVAAMTGGEIRLVEGADASACGSGWAGTPMMAGTVLCVSVAAADPTEVRRELVGAAAGTAAAALVAATLLGALLAGRIAAPIRRLTERAESISERHRGPGFLMPEKDETQRLTVAFDRMLDGLAASEDKRVAAERVAAWEEMARRLAHEVKNPLSPIRLAVENLRRTRERAPETFDRAFQEETGTILEQVTTLSALVDEFSQFARLPSPRLQTCDPRAVVSGALALYHARIGDGGVRVELDDREAPASFRADPEQLGRAFGNVVQNALDAMEGAPRKVLAVSVRRDGERTRFRVSDSGPGFSPEVLRRAFEPYVTTRRGAGGTGLGLAIAQRIVAEHGGTIAAENVPGGGAAVTICI